MHEWLPPFARRLTSPVLLVAASVLVVGGDLWGEEAWGRVPLGGSLFMALCLFALAIVLAIWAMVLLQASLTPQKHITLQGKPAHRPKLAIAMGAVLLLHLAVAVACCRMFPADDIDTYTFQHEAAKRLVHGVDPYGGSQADPYTAASSARFYGPGTVVNGRVQVGLQYPPLTLLWVLPGYLLGDIRLSYVFAVMLTAFLLFQIAPNGWGLGLALFLLLNPFTFEVENRCWTEPLVLLWMAATVYAASRGRGWLPLAFGMLLASKQYSVLALPLAVMLQAPFSWKQMLSLLAESLPIAAMPYIPFALWGVHALLHDLVLFHLRQPFRADALSFAVVAPVMLKIGPLLLLGFLVWAIWKLRGAAMFAAAFGVAVLLFFVTGKQAFANYFFLVAGCWLVSAAALRIPSERSPGAAF